MTDLLFALLPRESEFNFDNYLLAS